jgi:hypothetical protein
MVWAAVHRAPVLSAAVTFAVFECSVSKGSRSDGT